MCEPLELDIGNDIMRFICTGAPLNSRCECMTNLNRTVIQTMNSFVKLLKIIILSESCSKNCVGKIVQQFTSEGLMNCFGELPNKFTSEDCPTYLYRRVAHY